MRDDFLIDLEDHGEVEVRFPAFVAEDEQGKAKLVRLDRFKWQAELKKNIGREVQLALVRAKRQRSHPQNRFYWGVVLAVLLDGFRKIAADAGEHPPFRTKEQVHEAMKHRFLGLTVVRLPGGEEMETPSTTTLLTPAQFSAYWEAIAAWAAERYGIYIPDPQERQEPLAA